MTQTRTDNPSNNSSSPSDTKPAAFQEVQAPTLPEKPKSKLRPLLVVGLLAAGIAGGWWYYSMQPKAGPLQLSGRIEGYETDIGAKVPGRIDFIAVREGDQVKKGQVIVRMDDAEVKAQLEGANARLNAAQQQERQARVQLAVSNSQIQESQLNVEQAQGDSKGRIFQAQANVASAQAQLQQAEAQVNQARAELRLANLDRERFRQLTQEGAAPQQQLDQAQTKLETAQATLKSREAAVNSFRKLVNAAQGQLDQAQTTGLNPRIRNAQLNSLRNQLAQNKLKLAASQADVKSAQAARQQIVAQMAYLNVVSPIEGVVTARSVEPGAVVTSGKTLLSLVNLNTVYLRGYIPEGEIGKIRVGQKANVFLDSAPAKGLSAKVTAIDPQASFTPENIYFRDERVKQVFGVKLAIDNPGGFAKPGMPADGEILTEPEPETK
jgi:HlyD family secretion protein